jgi:hypothetical protein
MVRLPRFVFFLFFFCYSPSYRDGVPTQYICVFRVVLTVNSDCFPKQHYPVGICNGDVMFPVRYELLSILNFKLEWHTQ